jgi:hypothetical protein
MAMRRTFSSEFKREAVRLVTERGVAISAANTPAIGSSGCWASWASLAA